MLVLGYTLFAAALFIRLWMLLLALRWEKVMPPTEYTTVESVCLKQLHEGSVCLRKYCRI